eukprot:CAMPEP_0201578314 /NCGR_PEP_ID=MMETSP0190_2-20130828/25128_1 /ASSEMBLY_ACC=CAM_ASM_000263 /TAXON_ID=37353 /ORGANISM="Rosalina sp." /LENGTH=85 /DNA_ID=CAMNT_0048011355 /DNA_START=29 /DNA_END=283 /DNA_ORIENTATION=+
MSTSVSTNNNITSSRTYTRLSQTTYHEGVDNDVVCDVWRSYLREWSKQSDKNNNEDDMTSFEIPKPAQLLAVAHGVPTELRSEIW